MSDAAPIEAWPAARLPRGCARRRQDLRHARRGLAPQGAGGRCRRRLRGDPPSAEDAGAGPRPRGGAAAAHGVPGDGARGDGRRRPPRPPPRRGARRRAGAHERARQSSGEALGGRRGAAGGRHRRDHDRQHPAPREPERRDRADHGHPPTRDGPRCRGPSGRPDRARGHEPGGAPTPDGAREHLPGRAGRRGAGELLPPWQPGRAPGARPPVGRRPGRGEPPYVHGGPRDHRTVGDARARRRGRDRGSGR